MRSLFWRGVLLLPVVGCSSELDEFTVLTVADAGAEMAANDGDGAGTDGSKTDDAAEPRASAAEEDDADPEQAGLPEVESGEPSSMSPAGSDEEVADATGGPVGSSDADDDTAGMSDPEGSAPQPTPNDGECSAPEAQPPGACAVSLSGVYAFKTEFDVWWTSDTQYIMDPGRGQVTVYQVGTLEAGCHMANGGGIVDSAMAICGVEVPLLTAGATCRAYSITFSDGAWNSDSMPTFETSGTVTGFEPGSVLALAPHNALVGIDLPSVDAPWPTPDATASFACSAGSGQACFPDHDGDSRPGITASSMGEGPVGALLPPASLDCPGAFGEGYSLSALPLSVLGGSLPTPDQLTSEVHLGLRIRIGGGGMIDDGCMSGAGDAVAGALETRVYGCKRVDGMPCDATQAAFVDAKTPVYKILQKGDVPSWPAAYASDARIPKWTIADTSASEGPKSAFVRLGDMGDDVRCEDVRRAFDP